MDNVISSYTDGQAVEDGVLVRLDGYVNRVTRAVWSDYTEDMGGAGVMTDITRLTNLIARVQAEGREEDGWVICEGSRIGEADRNFWLVPNEVNGLTLMYPEDY